MKRRRIAMAVVALAGCGEILGVEPRELVADGDGGSPAGGGGERAGGGGSGGTADEGGNGGGPNVCDSDPCAVGCTNMFTSEQHCGACGQACADGGACLAGVCDRRLQGAAGTYTLCARRESGLVCWGDNSYGQIGAGFASADQPPLLVTVLPERKDFLFAVSPITATCAVSAEGELHCFGSGLENALGINTQLFTDDGLNVMDCCEFTEALEPAMPDFAHTIDIVGGGGYWENEFKCALDADGTVRCWGRNAKTPQNKVIPPAVQVVAGVAEACALHQDGGVVTCWISETSYGNSVATGDPFTVEGLPPIRLLGYSQNLLAVGFDNELYVSGPAANGVMGPTLPVSDAVYYPPQPFGWRFPDTIRQVTGTAWGACALLVTGEVYCWGRNGVQGNGTPEDGEVDPIPRKVLVEDVLEIAGSYHEMIARTEDGQIHRWGPLLATYYPEAFPVPD